jgi:hypothetical protein
VIREKSVVVAATLEKNSTKLTKNSPGICSFTKVGFAHLPEYATFKKTVRFIAFITNISLI